MINLPNSTKVCKQMPKDIFYKYLNFSDTLKKSFIDEIDCIIWMNQISPETMIISQGNEVAEIAVMEIVLKRQEINPNLLEILNREINQYAIFIVRYEEWGKILCCWKETEDNLKGDTCSQTNWMSYEDLILEVQGMDLDQVYENFLMQITGEKISIKNETRLKVILEKEEKLKKMGAGIQKMEAQMNSEIPFNRQLKLMNDLKMAKEEIQAIRTSKPEPVKTLQPETMELPLNNIETIHFILPNVVMKLQEE
ncbi:DUF4391 domain-containing protein [Acetobacterium tundrae]|uniref:DUF4391 family protein n=1 Tax=Acetobacterium tundrae TaxID=132932 RepID=A0ABR6WLZ8_9FIRM|nr:DUF4391 domain-containing protein [Acetobacterium tundrae]MBC3797293.1 DUF4391 family protein [Acetobacterium tundrae]